MPLQDEFEKSITTKFRAKIWSRFVKALKEYELISPGDKVCVCISGGKDSMLMARLFMQLQKHSDFDFSVEYLLMNPGYNEENQKLNEENLKLLGIPAKIIKTNIFDIANIQKSGSPCFLCAKMRRGALYNTAKQLGCNKIALGHHYDDVIETTLMNMLNSGSFQTMLPKLHSTNYKGMELIRPMYFIREKDIIAWKNYHNLHFIQCACKLTESLSHAQDGSTISQRYNTKQLIKNLRDDYNPDVEKSIFKAGQNVTLDMVGGYREGGKYHSFLDLYKSNIVHKKSYNSYVEALTNLPIFKIEMSEIKANIFIKFYCVGENKNLGPEITNALDDKLDCLVFDILDNDYLSSTREYVLQKNEKTIIVESSSTSSDKKFEEEITNSLPTRLTESNLSCFIALYEFSKSNDLNNQNIVILLKI